MIHIKLSELIAYCDAVKPNAYDSATKTIWVNEVEGMVMANILESDSADMQHYNYIHSATWTGAGVTFPTTETMLLPTATTFHIGGFITISGLTTNAVNNKTTAVQILDIDDDGTTLTFADDTFTVGLTADAGTAAITFDGTDTVLLIPFPHDKIYRSYLCAMIDFANGEYDKYNNSMMLFNKQFGELTEWYARKAREKA